MAKKTGNPVGRPPKYNNVEELEALIEEYYEWCEIHDKPLTFERLATFLDVDRRTIYSYSQKDEFLPTFKRVKERILSDIMEKGMANEINPTFGIFCLKNYGYSDKQEVVSTNTNVNKNVDMNNISTEDLKKLIADEN